MVGCGVMAGHYMELKYSGLNIDTSTALPSYIKRSLFMAGRFGGSILSQQKLPVRWYLPSIDELSQLKKNLYDMPLGLAPGHFWSSTTTVAGEAWCLGTDAVNDAPDQFLISSYATVCAVRSF